MSNVSSHKEERGHAPEPSTSPEGNLPSLQCVTGTLYPTAPGWFPQHKPFSLPSLQLLPFCLLGAVMFIDCHLNKYILHLYTQMSFTGLRVFETHGSPLPPCVLVWGWGGQRSSTSVLAVPRADYAHLSDSYRMGGRVDRLVV